MTKRKIKKNKKNPYQIVNLLKYLGLELGKKSNYNNLRATTYKQTNNHKQEIPLLISDQ